MSVGVIPDRVGYVEGWKELLVAWSGRTMAGDLLGLLSPVQNTLWVPDHPLVARHAGLEHEAPAKGCYCGIHALKELEALREWTSVLLRSVEVVARLALWGRVIEGTEGYRAQFAYPLAFYVAPDPYERGAALRRTLLDSFHVPTYVYPSFDALVEGLQEAEAA